MSLSVMELKTALSAPLLNVVAQGGRLKSLPYGGGCLLSCLWLENSNGWFELMAIEYENEDDYEFGLFLEKSDFSPLLEQSKFIQPPLKLVDEFPILCQLDLLRNSQALSILVDVEFIRFDDRLDVMRSIRLSCGDNVFDFKASDKYPENIEIYQNLGSD